MKTPKTTRTEREYVLGTGRDELIRLGFQHQLWVEYAANAWDRAGFGPGHRLIDVGCGPGYATCDLSARVAERGHVTAIDASERFIGHLESQARHRDLTNIVAFVGDIERLKLAKSAFDGAYARWVLCYVRHPEAVIAGVERALKRGGVFVVQEYFNYEGVLISPNCDVFKRVFRMVARSWRMRGGNPDVGAEIPGVLARCGFVVRETKPIVRAARPGSPLWKWPETFFAIYLPALVEMGLIDESDQQSFQREWRKRSRDPSAFFVTPPMLEIIAVKK